MVQKTVKLNQIFRLELNPILVKARPSDQGKVFVRFQPSDDEYYVVELDSETVQQLYDKRSELKALLEAEVVVKGTVVEHKRKVVKEEIQLIEIWETVE